MWKSEDKYALTLLVKIGELNEQNEFQGQLAFNRADGESYAYRIEGRLEGTAVDFHFTNWLRKPRGN